MGSARQGLTPAARTKICVMQLAFLKLISQVENDLRNGRERLQENVFEDIEGELKEKLLWTHLYTLPEKGRTVPELQGQGIFQYRELIIPPWRLSIGSMNEKYMFYR